MGYDPNIAQQMVQTVEPKEVLAWTQVAYYGAGALVALCVAFIKGRGIYKRWRARREKKSKESSDYR